MAKQSTTLQIRKSKNNIDLEKLEDNKQNTVSVLFTGQYNHSGVGLHHYIDPTDK